MQDSGYSGPFSWLLNRYDGSFWGLFPPFLRDVKNVIKFFMVLYDYSIWTVFHG